MYLTLLGASDAEVFDAFLIAALAVVFAWCLIELTKRPHSKS